MLASTFQHPYLLEWSSLSDIRQARILDNHFWVTVLQSLPEAQSHLDDTPIFMPPMVTEPDKSRAVFVHALRQCPPVILPEYVHLLALNPDSLA